MTATITPGREEFLALADKYARKATFLGSALIDDDDRLQAAEYRKIEYALRLAAKPADEGEADKVIGEIEKRFPDWKSYRDLVDCIDCTLHSLRREHT
jgi:hypothetical protein